MTVNHNPSWPVVRKEVTIARLPQDLAVPGRNEWADGPGDMKIAYNRNP